MLDTQKPKPATWLVIAAFLAVYTIWGSTYLGIKLAIDTIPPFLMAASRFLIAGTLLYIFARRQGAPAPVRLQWRSAFIIGTLMLLAGNGGVTWAESRIPTGLAALLVASVPLWMVLLDWLRPGGKRPSTAVLVGVFIGFLGIALLINPTDMAGNIDLLPMLLLLFTSFCWGLGSIYSRGANLPSSPLLSTGMQMLCGGALLLVAGTLNGEWSRLNLDNITSESALALAYLILIGSLIGYTAYAWLLRVQPSARVATYAYVNPVVAVFLGWAFLSEEVTPRTIVAAGIIIAAVVIITTYRQRQPGGASVWRGFRPVKHEIPASLPIGSRIDS